MIDEILEDTRERMKKSVATLRQELIGIRTGRANPALLDVIKVEYYGTVVPLRQVANVAAPDSRLLVVQAFDRNVVNGISRAISMSDLGLVPQVDGNLIRLPVPALTEERRLQLVKHVHRLSEDGRVAIRNIRRDANDMVRELEKGHDVSEDNSHKAQDKIQKMTDEFIKDVDELMHWKEKEIMIE
jgi:ribosome recycling factor